MNTETEQPNQKQPERPSQVPQEPAPERDRRGVPLPPRQRVGGIITPQ